MLLDDLAAAVERAVDSQERIRRPEPRRPQDGAEALEVEGARPGGKDEGRRVSPFRAPRQRMRVDAAQHLDEARVCRGDVLGQIVGEDGTEPVEALEAAGDRDAERREAVEAEVLAAVRAAERKQRHALRRLDVWQLVDRPVEVAEHLEPVEDVAAAVPARRA